jgi:hypothetical protein
MLASLPLPPPVLMSSHFVRRMGKSLGNQDHTARGITLVYTLGLLPRCDSVSLETGIPATLMSPTRAGEVLQFPENLSPVCPQNFLWHTRPRAREQAESPPSPLGVAGMGGVAMVGMGGGAIVDPGANLRGWLSGRNSGH